MSVPPLLLIHGYPFDHSLWEHVARLLTPKIEVLTPDLPGFGGRPALPGEPGLERMADDMAALLDQRQIERVVMAGMSMGGYVALAFADRYAPRLAGLALVSSQAAADTEPARNARREMIQKVQREGPGVAAQATIPKLFSPRHSQRPELVRYPQAGAEQAGIQGISWALEAMARRPDRTDLLKSLRVPVVVAHGVDDQLIPAERARELAGLIPNAQYVELPDSGHATPLEAPQPLASALAKLVERSTTP
jgi:pimeloyl-ACP methyl ester carboxylesterase